MPTKYNDSLDRGGSCVLLGALVSEKYDRMTPVRLLPQNARRLKSIAKLQRRSLSIMANLVIEAWLNAHGDWGANPLPPIIKPENNEASQPTT